MYAGGGFATSTGVIAKEAGLSHGAIFTHFPTREALICCLLERFGDEIGAKLHGMAATGCIDALLAAHLDVLRQYEGFYARLVSEVATLPIQARNTLVAIQSVASLHFRKALERGRHERLLRRVPAHMLFNMWHGLVNYYLQNADLFAPGESVLERRKDELVRAFTALISDDETEET